MEEASTSRGSGVTFDFIGFKFSDLTKGAAREFTFQVWRTRKRAPRRVWGRRCQHLESGAKKTICNTSLLSYLWKKVGCIPPRPFLIYFSSQVWSATKWIPQRVCISSPCSILTCFLTDFLQRGSMSVLYNLAFLQDFPRQENGGSECLDGSGATHFGTEVEALK